MFQEYALESEGRKSFAGPLLEKVRAELAGQGTAVEKDTRRRENGPQIAGTEGAAHRPLYALATREMDFGGLPMVMMRSEAKRAEQTRLLSFDIPAAEKELGELQLKAKAVRMAETGASRHGTYGTFGADTRTNQGTTDDTRDRIRTLQREMAKAKNAQDAARYSAYFGADDFARYSAEGAAIPNPGLEEAQGAFRIAGKHLFGPEPGNIVTYSRANAGRIALGEASGSQVVGKLLYSFMTDDEVSLYNYLLAKEGQESAKEFLAYLEETLNYRFGTLQGEAVRGIENPVGRTLATGLYGVTAGVDQWAGEVKQLATEKRLPTSPTQYGSAFIMDDLKDTGPKILGHSLGQMAYGTVTTTAHMAPSILVSALTSGAGAPAAVAQGAGAVAVGAAAVGGAYNQALGEGYGRDEAMNYAVLVGASETTLQYLLGGIGALGGKLTGNVAKTTVQNIDNALLRIAGTLGVKMFGEGTEEYLQEILEPAFRNLAFDENNEIKLVTEDAAYSFLMGALTTGLMEGKGVVQDGLAPGRANAAIDTAYGTMGEHGIFSAEATGAVQKANQALGLPTWAENVKNRVVMMPGAPGQSKTASAGPQSVQMLPGFDGSLRAGEQGEPHFYTLPIFDGGLDAGGTPALPIWGTQEGKTVDNPGENGIIVGRGTEGAGDASKIPWDSWKNYEKVIKNGQEYAKVGDRLYSRHAVNRMQPSGNRFGPNIYLDLYGEDYGRSVAPQFVEDVIHSVKPFVQNNGNLVYISGTVKVVTNQQGSVITIVTYLK